MPVPSSDFSHFYEDCLKDLKLDKSQNEIDLNKYCSQEKFSPVQLMLYEEYDRILYRVIESLSFFGETRRPEPEFIIKTGFSAIKLFEQFRFILENILEGVKKDHSLQNMLRDFKSLGIIDFDVSNLKEEETITKQSPWESNYGSGIVINRLLNRLKKCALTVMELIANAIKVSSKFVSIKPKPSIGLSGPFPTFSLAFDLEAESMTIHELFQEMKGMFSED